MLDVLPAHVLKTHTAKCAASADRKSEALPGVPGCRAASERAKIPHVACKGIADGASRRRTVGAVGDPVEPTFGAFLRVAEFLELAERAVLLSAVVIAMSDDPGSSAGAKA
ncbi:MAG: hypothetical protein M3N91_17950 [Pseudomonadota bacterium]|nr:hypothetical protein [Pseudomonadota bacterium]